MMTHEQSDAPQLWATIQQWLGRHARLVIVAGFWVTLLGVLQTWAWYNDTTIAEVLRTLVVYASESMYGIFIFLGIAAFAPLVFFPASLLGVGAGFVFGPVLGILYTLLCCNVSATVAYILGHSARYEFDRSQRLRHLIHRYSMWLHRNDMLTVVMLRLAFVPYDMVNYAVGMLRMRWSRFILANTLGCLPGTIALVLFGASIERFDGVLPAFNPWVLAISVAVLGTSAILAWYLRRHVYASDDDAPVSDTSGHLR